MCVRYRLSQPSVTFVITYTCQRYCFDSVRFSFTLMPHYLGSTLLITVCSLCKFHYSTCDFIMMDLYYIIVIFLPVEVDSLESLS